MVWEEMSVLEVVPNIDTAVPTGILLAVRDRQRKDGRERTFELE